MALERPLDFVTRVEASGDEVARGAGGGGEDARELLGLAGHVARDGVGSGGDELEEVGTVEVAARPALSDDGRGDRKEVPASDCAPRRT